MGQAYLLSKSNTRRAMKLVPLPSGVVWVTELASIPGTQKGFQVCETIKPHSVTNSLAGRKSQELDISDSSTWPLGADRARLEDDLSFSEGITTYSTGIY